MSAMSLDAHQTAHADDGTREVNVDPAAVNVLSLFSGAGGLDLGVRMALANARTVCYVEREAYACAVLAARMEDGSLDSAPIWTDVTTFSGAPWRGVVDCIIGGFPCQDISVAGKGGGVAEGNRSGLWREFARIIREVGPRFVFVENVSALVNRGLDIVVGDLADLGFDAEWDLFSAAEIGAPHIRQRLFLFAYAGGERLRLQPWRSGGKGRQGARELIAYGETRHAAESSAWEAAPQLRGMDDGLADRVDRLRLCGNGVVPQQAAYAFGCLMARAGQ